jgi:ABC-type dipeptide/oligopeptide/nickel transport system permease subunit
MAQTFRPQQVFTLLNSDGKAHPRENTFALATAVFGLVAAISAIFPAQHLLSSWTGLAGIVTGGYGQFISATTGERFVLIIGLGAAAVGLLLGVAHGGLWGGL